MPEGTEPELSIIDVLRHYGAEVIPESSAWRSMKCPFHSDAHASGRVNTELNAYKCQGCPYAGSPLSLIKRKEALGSYAEATEFAGTVLGKSVSRVQRTVSKSVKRRPLGREKWTGILE
jgi:DNA primase